MNHFMGKFLQSLILRQFEVEWDTWATIQGIVAPGSRDANTQIMKKAEVFKYKVQNKD